MKPQMPLTQTQSAAHAQQFYMKLGPDVYQWFCQSGGWDGRQIIAPYVPKYSDPQKRVLELGCAHGYVLKLFENAGAQTFGVDYVNSMVMAARGSCPASTIIESDLNQRLPFNDSMFHFIFCLSVLEYSIDIGNVFEEASRLLIKDDCARFVFTVIQRDDSYDQGEAVKIRNLNGKPVKFYRYNFSMLSDIGDRYGLRIEYLETFKAFDAQSFQHTFYYGLYEARSIGN